MKMFLSSCLSAKWNAFHVNYRFILLVGKLTCFFPLARRINTVLPHCAKNTWWYSGCVYISGNNTSYKPDAMYSKDALHFSLTCHFATNRAPMNTHSPRGDGRWSLPPTRGPHPLFTTRPRGHKMEPSRIHKVHSDTFQCQVDSQTISNWAAWYRKWSAM